MMRPLVHDSQFAEVLVQRHEDATLAMGSGENLVVARVFGRIASELNIVASGPQPTDGTTPDARIPGAASSIPGDEERFYSLATDDAAGVRQTGEDVFRLEPRIALQYGLVIVACRQHSQHVLDGQTTASHDRFAAVNPRIGRDSLKEVYFVYSHSILSYW